MSVASVQELIDSGVHFGHQASLWNPKMRPFIHGRRNAIHVIDLRETIRGLLRARHFLFRLAAQGAQILIVGTKRQIKEVVAVEANRAQMPSVTERWIGGTLTNYHTIRSRMERLEELEKLESDGSIEKHSKKMQATMRREMRKIARNLSGIRTLDGLPGALLVIDPKHEDIAVKEAARMNVPVVAILDTDCNPDMVDIPIPGNDDALRSVQLLLKALADAMVEGRQNMDVQAAQFRSEVPELRGRDEKERPRGGRTGGAGRPGGRFGGRFAEPARATGPVEQVSFGRQTEEEMEATARTAGKGQPETKPAAESAPPAEPATSAEPPAEPTVEPPSE